MNVHAGWPALLALALLAVACASSPADPAASSCSGFVFSSLELGGRSYPYALYVPRAYDGARYPSRWAALVPICGYAAAPPREPVGVDLAPPFTGSATELAPALAGLPIWAFHGERDDTVPVEATLQLTAAVRAAGGSPTVTIVPGAGHNSWDAAYRDPRLAEWMLQRVRGEEAR